MARLDDAFPAVPADRLAAGGWERVEERSTVRFRLAGGGYPETSLADALGVDADPSTASRDELLALLGGVS